MLCANVFMAKLLYIIKKVSFVNMNNQSSITGMRMYFLYPPDHIHFLLSPL